jgi:hypothetical protein
MSAVISDCGTYRYQLTRELGPQLGGPVFGACVFVMLNPSTADAEQDDPTIRRCIGFARSMRMTCLRVVNLFAYRATDPARLRALSLEDAIGPENDEHIADACRLTHDGFGIVICAWGANETRGRDREVLEIIRRQGVTPYALGVTKAGHPRHPLYLKKTAVPTPLAHHPDAGEGGA